MTNNLSQINLWHQSSLLRRLFINKMQCSDNAVSLHCIINIMQWRKCKHLTFSENSDKKYATKSLIVIENYQFACLYKQPCHICWLDKHPCHICWLDKQPCHICWLDKQPCYICWLDKQPCHMFLLDKQLCRICWLYKQPCHIFWLHNNPVTYYDYKNNYVTYSDWKEQKSPANRCCLEHCHYVQKINCWEKHRFNDKSLNFQTASWRRCYIS